MAGSALRPAQRVSDCCGSRSITATLRPASAQAAARCASTVVLPAPPFCCAKVMAWPMRRGPPSGAGRDSLLLSPPMGSPRGAQRGIGDGPRNSTFQPSGRRPRGPQGRAARPGPPPPRRRSPRSRRASPCRGAAPGGRPRRGRCAARCAAGRRPGPTPSRIVRPSSQKSTAPSMTWIASSSLWWTCSGGPSPAGISGLERAEARVRAGDGDGVGDAEPVRRQRACAAAARAVSMFIGCSSLSWSAPGRACQANPRQSRAYP